MATEKSELKSRELKVLTERESRNKPGAGYKLRIVQYYQPAKNGTPAKSIAVKLESGEYWKGDDEIVRFKAKGLTLLDVRELLKTDVQAQKRVIQVVEALMATPPELPSEQEEAAPQSAPDPEVPFS